jgi:transposase-like protein
MLFWEQDHFSIVFVRETHMSEHEQSRKRQAYLRTYIMAGSVLRGEVSQNLGISEQTYYRWRKEYGVSEVMGISERRAGRAL